MLFTSLYPFPHDFFMSMISMTIYLVINSKIYISLMNLSESQISHLDVFKSLKIQKIQHCIYDLPLSLFGVSFHRK